MNFLFPHPPGFSYYPDFLDVAEEEQLLKYISGLTLKSFIFQGFEAKRRTLNFGYDWSFDRRVLSEGIPIPEFFFPVIEKAAPFLKVDKSEIKELLIIEYPVDSVMNWHRDAPPFDKIAGISLLSDCSFRFRPYDKLKRGRKSIHSVTVQRRSLYIMDGEARSEWEHSVLPAKTPRYSVTLRTLR